MAVLTDIIDYGIAPLAQWEPVVGEPLSPGKRHEDELIYGAIAEELAKNGATTVTGIIADEARLELHLAEHVEDLVQTTHLTLKGAFETAARHNKDQAPPANADKVFITTNTNSILPKSQDAVVLNMILGCIAVPENAENIVNLVKFSASLLKPEGELIIVRPNPAAGGEFSTYICNTNPGDLKGGEEYEFTVKGLEEYGPMRNLHTPDDFLAPVFRAAGLQAKQTQGIQDKPMDGERIRPEPAFLMTVCKPA